MNYLPAKVEVQTITPNKLFEKISSTICRSFAFNSAECQAHPFFKQAINPGVVISIWDNSEFNFAGWFDQFWNFDKTSAKSFAPFLELTKTKLFI